jgi:hypothetical protein
MRYLVLLFVPFLLAAGSVPLTAQAYPYFSVESEPYVPLQGGTNLVNSTWDDPEFVVPFGFDFTFFNQTIDRVGLSSGFSIVSLADNLLSNVTSLFILFGADLIDRGYLDNQHLSHIRYATSGITGERVFTLEYENAGFLGDLFSNGTSSDYINFQMKLYEASGDIVYHFGPTSVSYPELDFGVLSGPIIGIAEDYDIETDEVLGDVILLSGSPSAPDVNTDYDNHALDGAIPENTVYRFSREIMSGVSPVKEVEAQLYYPNPATDMLYLKQDVAPIERVMMYTSTGQKVLETTDVQSIPLKSLLPATYVLKMESKSALRTQKVIVLPH